MSALHLLLVNRKLSLQEFAMAASPLAREIYCGTDYGRHFAHPSQLPAYVQPILTAMSWRLCIAALIAHAYAAANGHRHDGMDDIVHAVCTGDALDPLLDPVSLKAVKALRELNSRDWFADYHSTLVAVYRGKSL